MTKADPADHIGRLFKLHNSTSSPPSLSGQHDQSVPSGDVATGHVSGGSAEARAIKEPGAIDLSKEEVEQGQGAPPVSASHHRTAGVAAVPSKAKVCQKRAFGRVAATVRR